MTNENLGYEPSVENEIIAPELMRYRDMFYTVCGNLENAYSVISLLAERSVALSKDSCGWYYTIAKDLFMVARDTLTAAERVNYLVSLIGQPTVKDINFDDVPQSDLDDSGTTVQA